MAQPQAPEVLTRWMAPFAVCFTRPTSIPEPSTVLLVLSAGLFAIISAGRARYCK